MTLEFDGIQFQYNENPLLSGVYVKCETGRIVGLLGRNGSGKSTLLRIVFGSLKSEVKSVRIDGRHLNAPLFSSRTVSYLPQSNLVPSYLTLHQALKLYKIRFEKIETNFPELKDVLHYRKDMLSGGVTRLIENLMILYSPSPFCFFDEPFSGLAPVMIDRLIECMLKEKNQKGILITDHLFRHVTKVSDDLYVLTNGRTYRVNDKDDLIRRGYLADE
jgi:ABC-type multidrug transport system ATPase subunit